MKVLLLGNGFDLNHKFPTSYINFLNTVTFMREADREKISTIGHVFGSEELQKKDPFIRECYEVHSCIYDEVAVDKKSIEAIVDLAQENLWFNYLSDSVAKNMTWIDFEKEIVRVLEAFFNFFESEILKLENNHVIFDFAEFKRQEDKYIIKCFPFFFEKMENQVRINAEMMRINDKFVKEKISGSGTYHLCEDKIIDELYKSLRALADILKLYLKVFVDEPSLEYAKLGIKPKFVSLPAAEQMHSFNYTNTYEILYRPNVVEHIHGNTNTDIVLGVNPDKTDEVYSIDTAFLQFKKYFQRTFYSTDNTFLKKIYGQQRARTLEGIELYVVGHSLDVTDKDIIQLVFESASKIYVLYHSDISAKSQIRNLVEIYGKQGLDRLRAEKDLCFLKQSEVEWIFPTIEKAD